MKTAALIALAGATVASAFSPATPSFGLQTRAVSTNAISALNMGKSYDEKEAIVDTVRDRLGSAALIFSTPLEGINMPEINKLRNALPEGTNAVVIKNRLLKRAVRGSPWVEVNDVAKQSNLWVIVDSDLQGSIKAFREWGKANKKGEIKNGVLEGRIYNGKGIETIGDLPSKDQLYAQIAGGINAIPTQIARLAREAGAQKLARAVKLAVSPDA